MTSLGDPRDAQTNTNQAGIVSKNSRSSPTVASRNMSYVRSSLTLWTRLRQVLHLANAISLYTTSDNEHTISCFLKLHYAMICWVGHMSRDPNDPNDLRRKRLLMMTATHIILVTRNHSAPYSSHVTCFSFFFYMHISRFMLSISYSIVANGMAADEISTVDG